jgi:hypothetical protein
LNPAEYHALPQPEQRKAALALGSARLGLAVALAAECGASSPYGYYTYWLNLWRCPALPRVLVQRGWKWNVAGTALANDRWSLAIHATGEQAIDMALQIVIKHLAAHERAALLEPIREVKQEALL